LGKPDKDTQSRNLTLDKMKVEQRLVGVEEVAHMLDMSKDTIYKWACQRKIPSVKCGRLLKFDLQKIEKWIQANTIEEK
jgi:excisionase family DNA binding protein